MAMLLVPQTAAATLKVLCASFRPLVSLVTTVLQLLRLYVACVPSRLLLFKVFIATALHALLVRFNDEGLVRD